MGLGGTSCTRPIIRGRHKRFLAYGDGVPISIFQLRSMHPHASQRSLHALDAMWVGHAVGAFARQPLSSDPVDRDALDGNNA